MSEPTIGALDSLSFKTLKAWRLNKALYSQRTIAKRAQTTQGHISKIERGIMPRVESIAKFAEAYRLSTDEFIRLCEGREAALKPVPTPAEIAKADAEALPLWQFAQSNIITTPWQSSGMSMPPSISVKKAGRA